MSKTFDEERVRGLMRRAVADGATIGKSLIQWDIAGGCEMPPLREIRGMIPRNVAESLGDEGRKAREFTDKQTNWSGIELKVRCRKCEPCRRYRRSLWRSRATIEFAGAIRTWFGTLTLSPHQHTLALLRAQSRAAKRGVNWETDLSERERTAARVNAITPMITKYFKRLRAGNAERGFNPASFRYLYVSELHKSGLPHFHALLHEIDEEHPVRKAALDGQWEENGFSKWKLALPAHCGYVTKYLMKSDGAWIRASVGYGRPDGIEDAKQSYVKL